MLKVGLTGGIASGKSLVEREFAALGVPVADADVLSRELSAPGGVGLKALVDALGSDIRAADGGLDRGRLRQRLFADPGLRQRVEKLLHPLILQGIKGRLEAASAPYALAVIPLLVEVPAARVLVDRVLLVDCSESLQLTRLMSRDHVDEATARSIMAAQATRAERLRAADDILLNEGDMGRLREYVARLHGFYLELAAQGAPRRPGLRLP
ncbi:MAG TPA: dephospho-CoA kinase [Gammaproteobacteria bacterium]|nr:dephospho-CoA kinase [Gammaproteobacteria bacterium]